jgi:hypothetical protein
MVLRVSAVAWKNAIDGPLVLEGDVGNLFRHRKYNVKIGNLEKFGLPVLDPLGAGQGLAFGTVTIRTGVIPDALRHRANLR